LDHSRCPAGSSSELVGVMGSAVAGFGHYWTESRRELGSVRISVHILRWHGGFGSDGGRAVLSSQFQGVRALDGSRGGAGDRGAGCGGTLRACRPGAAWARAERSPTTVEFEGPNDFRDEEQRNLVRLMSVILTNSFPARWNPDADNSAHQRAERIFGAGAMSMGPHDPRRDRSNTSALRCN